EYDDRAVGRATHGALVDLGRGRGVDPVQDVGRPEDVVITFGLDHVDDPPVAGAGGWAQEGLGALAGEGKDGRLGPRQILGDGGAVQVDVVGVGVGVVAEVVAVQDHLAHEVGVVVGPLPDREPR